MKIVVINGSPRKGITHESMNVVKSAMQKLGEVEFVEFRLPQDLPVFCHGCFQCFMQGECRCPDAAQVQPIVQELLSADGWIIGSPIYALQLSAGLKALFDHTAYCFLNHRPRFFTQKALVITTTAGAGIKSTSKYIAQTMSFWGVNKIYQYGQPVMALKWDEIPSKTKEKLVRNLQRVAVEFYRDVESKVMHSPSFIQSVMFNAGKALNASYDDTNEDKKYWAEHGWLANDSRYFTKNAKLGPLKSVIGGLTRWMMGRVMKSK